MNDENGTQAIEIAENPEFGKVRIKWHDNQYLFAGKDVAKALGYKRPENAVTQHCKGILKLGIPSAGGIRFSPVVRRRSLRISFCTVCA